MLGVIFRKVQNKIQDPARLSLQWQFSRDSRAGRLNETRRARNSFDLRLRHRRGKTIVQRLGQRELSEILLAHKLSC